MNANGYNSATVFFHQQIYSAFCSSKPTLRYSSNNSINMCKMGLFQSTVTYVTGFAKRDLIVQIMIFLYRRF